MDPSLQRIFWLASYPKSGNTWMRAFLASYVGEGGKPVPINQIRNFTLSDTRQKFFDRAAGRPFSAADPMESVRLRPAMQRLLAAAKPGNHFVKTHSAIGVVAGVPLISPEVTAGAICILRNPFDLAPSYARHFDLTLDEAIDRMTSPDNVAASPSGIVDVLGRWDDHVASWTRAPGLRNVLVRYEDMSATPEKAFRKVLKFLRLPVDVARLRRAMAASSFDALRAQEDRDGFHERPAHMARFFAEGGVGLGRAKLSPAQTARLREAFRGALAEHYGDLDV